MTKTATTRDLDNRALMVERDFSAPCSRVWDAYTDPELLDQWWAPQPWAARTITMDFRVGGHWHYAMQGPDGQQHFARMDFLEIEPNSRYVAADVFADSSGIASPHMPRQTFTTSFLPEGETTRVIVVVAYESLEDLRKVVEMGIEQGVAVAQDQLEQLLAAA